MKSNAASLAASLVEDVAASWWGGASSRATVNVQPDPLRRTTTRRPCVLSQGLLFADTLHFRVSQLSRRSARFFMERTRFVALS